MNKMTRSFILMLVAAYLTQIGADDPQEINCTDKVCPANDVSRFAVYGPSDAARVIYITLGVTVGALIAFGVIVTVCIFCACCPVYKYRFKKGTIYASAVPQLQPVTPYHQPPYSTQQINTQSVLSNPSPGFIYSTGQAVPQTPYYSPVTQHQINPGIGPYAGQAVPQTPYYSPVTQHQINPGIGPYAGAPEVPPAFSQTSPQNQDMNTNFTSK